MRYNVSKNKYRFKTEEKMTGWRIENETDKEVLLDVALCRGEVVITVMDVYSDE